jgi:hypothetical protein
VLRALAVVLTLIFARSIAIAAPAPEPSGPHPRILLDEPLRTAWRAAAKRDGSAVAKAIARCADTRGRPHEHTRDSYMGFDWSTSLSACLIAWAVRGSDEDARQAVVYIQALLDDLERVGDGKGGEAAVRRDTGYAIRSMPPYVAIAYDWLHDHPALTPALKQRIRERFTQWLGWYKKSGYHNHSPGTNYHAGYLFSATLAAVALAGEGGFSSELWTHVRDDIWGTDMAKALAAGGVLDGGDFPEGWQYAPLSVVEYALAARVGERHGLPIAGVDRWLAAMFVRSMHARSGARDTIAAIGDTEEKTATIAPSVWTMLAILVGPASEAAQRQAAGEIARLGLVAKDFPLFEAVAQARGVEPATPVFDKWPLSYYAPGVNAFYARTSWRKDGVWLATICPPAYDADHLAPSAGNFLVTRGVDEVIVDPSPYGSLSSLTSNAPTVDSKQQVDKYRPSQAAWGQTTHFAWAVQTAAGVVATRCDYADQYKFQDKATDIDLAQRDLVLVPWGAARADASLVVIDRADTGAAGQAMYLRFRTPVVIGMRGPVARATIGASALAIQRVAPASGPAPEVRLPPVGACWEGDRGKCDAARFAVGEYRVTLPGPTPEAIHVLDVAAAGGTELGVDAAAEGVVHLARGGQHAYVAARAASYAAKAGAGVVHVAVAGNGTTTKLAASKSGDTCKVDVTTDGAPHEPGPLVVILDESCRSSDDARVGPGAPDLGGSAGATLISVGGVPTRKDAARRGRGCCDASGGGGASALVTLLVVLLSRGRTRSAARRPRC